MQLKGMKSEAKGVGRKTTVKTRTGKTMEPKHIALANIQSAGQMSVQCNRSMCMNGEKHKSEAEARTLQLTKTKKTIKHDSTSYNHI